ncbi:MAG: hypothetical protein DRR16_20850 [Candidatus Parabeggiatoa sp. nov. 3]|jgi:hypothetical protein|nr:MAG: hypothetical protein DRR00_06170 [Gammaproteobacteria bacterium]RKZ68123.1 MAG: hypothetical protein DRQ99_04750 [Gammaproteobacteria bacterium]RKZ81966.1 MAG: hypothetical protein DRR16_20850 [Gammaproteobacteria bacterium]
MNSHQVIDIQAFIQAAEFKRIGNCAVRKALEENRQLGIPNVFSRNGKLYYELPNGEITTEDPFKEISLSAAA